MSPRSSSLIDLSTGAQDRLTVAGSVGADTVVLGALGANLNADNDVDVTLTGVELATVSGSDGADVVSGAGDAATGAATSLGADAQRRQRRRHRVGRLG